MKSELWIAHDSIAAWQEPSMWAHYFAQAQQLLGSPITHLDVNDPIRRKVANLEAAGAYVCDFKPREDSRSLFGKCEKSGVGFSIEHHRFPNTLNTLMWHVPLAFMETPENRQRIKSLFELGNHVLKSFYAFSDERAVIASGKKSSGSVNVQAELLGAFWFTYFNAAYVRFFGESKFVGLEVDKREIDGGIMLVLADSPDLVTEELRSHVMEALGRQSFVDSRDILNKLPGRHALTFQQLNAESR